MGLIFVLNAPLDLSATLQFGFHNKRSIFKFIDTKTGLSNWAAVVIS